MKKLLGVTVLCVVAAGAVLSYANAQGATPIPVKPVLVGEGGVGGALLGAFMPTILTGLGTALTAAAGYGANFLKGRAKLVRNERVAKALVLLSDLVFDKVAQICQEAVADLKAASADGSLSPDEAAAAAKKAILETWQGLPADLKKLLTEITGSEAAAIDTYVKPKVESAVKAQRGPVPQLDRQVTPEMVNAARARLGLPPK